MRGRAGWLRTRAPLDAAVIASPVTKRTRALMGTFGATDPPPGGPLGTPGGGYKSLGHGEWEPRGAAARIYAEFRKLFCRGDGVAKKRKTEARVVPAAPAETRKSNLPPYVVETWSLDRLKPYDRNARRHSPAQVEQLRGSFKKFGQVWPLLVREDGTIIAGHGRYDAAKLEGFTEVRVIIATGWSAEQCRAFGLLDNKVALNSEWDEAALGLELADLSQLGVPLGELGFSDLELGELLAPDDKGEAPKERSTDLNPVIQFNIVFDDEGQQQQWFSFVRYLKTKYPDDETLGARLTKFIGEQTVAAG